LVDKQEQLVKIQTEHLNEQRAVVLANLKLRGHRERLKIGTEVFFAIVITAIAIGLLTMVQDAITSRSVIVEPFDAPPALAAGGMSGTAVASGFLDELTRLQAATRSAAAKRKLANDWTGDIKIDIPETGISIDEVGRLLHKRFGHDLHIGGTLVQTQTGDLVLSVRGDGILPKTFTGSVGDLGKLTIQAAEYVYGESQPGLFTTYLYNMDRNDEAIAFAKAHLAQARLADQPYLLNAWGNAVSSKGGISSMARALPLWKESVRIDSNFWEGYNDITYGLIGIGREEDAVQAGRKMLKLARGRPGNAPEIFYQNYDGLIYNLQAYRAAALADIAQTGGINPLVNGAEMLSIAQTDVQIHDVDAADLRLASAVWDQKSPPDIANAAVARAWLAEEVGDLTAASNAWDDYAVAYADPGVATASPWQICWAAPTFQRTGHPAKADAALDAPIKAIGIGHFVDCYRFRADVLDLRGDWAGAQAWYARAVNLAPDVPSGSYSWGLALARRGDLAGAAAKFEAANQAGPHWADPLKAWGDVLMRQGQAKAALTKYDQALKYAPLWKQLHQARDAAARQVG
jgi:tetratricopeptide (TPR) repeat protein